MSGKGDKPRSGYCNTYRNNYEEIDWQRDNSRRKTDEPEEAKSGSQCHESLHESDGVRAD